MREIIWAVLGDIWLTIGQMAPYLLLGYLAAGILSVLVSEDLVQRHLGGDGILPTIKAAVFGMPLPLCSCGVIPVTASLRDHGAGRGASAAFLISTPTTGVDSIAAAWALMGPVFAIYRALMAIVLGIFGGMMANLFGGRDLQLAGKPENEAKKTDCPHCAAAAAKVIQVAEQEMPTRAKGNCCADSGKLGNETAVRSKFWRALRYGFYQLPRGLTRPLALGIIAAGLISALVREDYLTPFLGSGIGTMLLMLAIGLPLYICSTAAIPLALGFLALGASPGAAMVFLVAGPAANAATVTVLWRLIGGRSAFIVFLTIAVGSILGGLLLDHLWAMGGFALPLAEHQHVHEELSAWFTGAAATVFILVQIASVWGGPIVAAFRRTQAAKKSCCGHGTGKEGE